MPVFTEEARPWERRAGRENGFNIHSRNNGRCPVAFSPRPLGMRQKMTRWDLLRCVAKELCLARTWGFLARSSVTTMGRPGECSGPGGLRLALVLSSLLLAPVLGTESPARRSLADTAAADAYAIRVWSSAQSNGTSPGSKFRTPPLGWNNYNAFHYGIDETIFKQTGELTPSSRLALWHLGHSDVLRSIYYLSSIVLGSMNGHP